MAMMTAGYCSFQQFRLVKKMDESNQFCQNGLSKLSNEEPIDSFEIMYAFLWNDAYMWYDPAVKHNIFDAFYAKVCLYIFEIKKKF